MTNYVKLTTLTTRNQHTHTGIKLEQPDDQEQGLASSAHINTAHARRMGTELGKPTLSIYPHPLDLFSLIYY